MRPDDGRIVDGTGSPFDIGLPFDPELAMLVGELEAGSARVRAARAVDGTERPTAAFATALRGRLCAELPTGGGIAGDRPGQPQWRRWAFDGGHDVTPRGISSRIERRTPTVLPAPRWTALAIAAAFVLAVVGLQTSVVNPALPLSRASGVAGATLVRGGVAGPLTGGAELQVGDEIRTATDGRATLELGESRARLDGSTTIRLDALANGRLELAQLDGRVYHRVGEDASHYTVTTASVTWTATGTAFDIARRDDPDGEIARLIAVEHDVGVDGPGLAALVTEGRTTRVRLSDETGLDVEAGPVDAATLTDRWLLRNARLDLALGFRLGIFDGVELAEATPTPEPTAAPGTAGPTSTPSAAPPTPTATTIPTPTPTATPAPTPRPTPKPTPKPTPVATPTPTPTPAPEIAALTLTATACNGAVVLDWSTYEGALPFNHYTVLRNTTAEIPLAYPPQGGAVDFGNTYTTNVAKSLSHDASLGSGATVWYRAMAFDGEDRVIGASVSTGVTTKGVKPLATLGIAPDAGGTRFAWSPYGGEGTCFTYYKLVYSADDPTPSYVEGSPHLWAGGSQAESTVVVADIAPGTYWFRLQAIRSTDFGTFVVAETDVTQYAVP